MNQIQKWLNKYIKFLDNSFKNSTFVVVTITGLIVISSIIVSPKSIALNIGKTNILWHENQQLFQNENEVIITIDWKKYRLILEKILKPEE